MLGAATCWVLLAVAPATDNPELARAESLLHEFRYDDALAALARARAQEGNDRSTLLRILELEGVAAGQLRRSKPAEEAFRELLALDPDHALGGDYAPRVMTPFYGAKHWLTEHGPFAFRALEPRASGNQVTEVGVEILSDALLLAREARFHVLGDTGEFAVTDVALVKGRAALPAAAPHVTWWAELLGEKKAQLGLLGDEGHPRVDVAPGGAAAVVTAPPPPPPPRRAEPPPAPAPAPPLEVRESAGMSGSRVAGYGLLAGAALAAGGGAAFGYRSHQELSQITNAPVDAQGRITSLTERQAYQLNDQSKRDALVANSLFAASGALAVAGGVLWLLGAPVTVTPTGQGVGVGGSF